LEELIEFLDTTDNYHAGTCHGMIKTPRTIIKKENQDSLIQSCNYEKRNWTMLIRNDGTTGYKSLPNRLVNFVECNMFEGAFVIRRRVFENFSFDTHYGDTVILDFFLRSKGKIRLASLTDCSLSEELHRRDRGALINNPFYTDYIKLGFHHNIVRIVRENQITWTKCS
jgi:hypothetical protein